MTEDNAAVEYRALLLERGIAVPEHALRGIDVARLCRSPDQAVAAAVRHGIFVVEDRWCARCGWKAPPGPEAIQCEQCPDRVRPGVMLILPPVAEVVSAVRDEVLRIGLEKGRRDHWVPFALILEGLASRAGVAVGGHARDAAEWVAGKWWGKDHPMDGFVHVIRSPLDPERESREVRRSKFGKGAASEWKKLTGGRVDEWKSRLLAILEDGEPRTFNAIMLEASGGTHTADVAHAKDPDKALWALVEEEAIEHTIEAPILFRTPTSRRTSRARSAR